jgi:hypothetical protein
VAEIQALRPTRSEVERVWGIDPTRCDLLKLETDATDHISGISRVWVDPLDNPAVWRWVSIVT